MDFLAQLSNAPTWTVFFNGKCLKKIRSWYPEWSIYRLRRKYAPDRYDIDYHSGQIRLYTVGVYNQDVDYSYMRKADV